MIIKSLMIVLLASIIPISAQAQSMDLQYFKQQFTSINERAKWKLFSEATDVEYYYDAENVQHPGPGSVIVVVKTVYKSQKIIDRLKHERKRNYTKGIEEPLNYDYSNFLFTINIYEIYCTMKKSGSQAIEADFDSRGNILNILPSARGVVPIRPGSYIEKLYSLICEKGK